MLLRELESSLTLRDRAFLNDADVVYVEVLHFKFLKLKDGDTLVDDTIYDLNHVNNELKQRENVFVMYQKYTECNMEWY